MGIELMGVLINNGKELLEFLQQFPPESLSKMELRAIVGDPFDQDAVVIEAPISFDGAISQETEGEWEYTITINIPGVGGQ